MCWVLTHFYPLCRWEPEATQPGACPDLGPESLGQGSQPLNTHSRVTRDPHLSPRQGCAQTSDRKGQRGDEGRKEQCAGWKQPPFCKMAFSCSQRRSAGRVLRLSVTHRGRDGSYGLLRPRPPDPAPAHVAPLLSTARVPDTAATRRACMGVWASPHRSPSFQSLWWLRPGCLRGFLPDPRAAWTAHCRGDRRWGPQRSSLRPASQAQLPAHRPDPSADSSAQHGPELYGPGPSREQCL